MFVLGNCSAEDIDENNLADLRSMWFSNMSAKRIYTNRRAHVPFPLLINVTATIPLCVLGTKFVIADPLSTHHTMDLQMTISLLRVGLTSSPDYGEKSQLSVFMKLADGSREHTTMLEILGRF
ncbi:hypothetical protein AVEN_452-1 [Araneus ventricosus]|uniref:Uncharacterized protein n=1 Tax=Araneus ventricosus TaxID=182803 RepID=A0A4Y2TDB9_ARAVE|nr:hypothetical protein AVEN_452-1 [Araneus ventricosus]